MKGGACGELGWVVGAKWAQLTALRFLSSVLISSSTWMRISVSTSFLFSSLISSESCFCEKFSSSLRVCQTSENHTTGFNHLPFCAGCAHPHPQPHNYHFKESILLNESILYSNFWGESIPVLFFVVVVAFLKFICYYCVCLLCFFFLCVWFFLGEGSVLEELLIN